MTERAGMRSGFEGDIAENPRDGNREVGNTPSALAEYTRMAAHSDCSG